MSDFTVRVELKGRPSERDEYVKLHELMGDEGFWPYINPPGPSGAVRPEGPFTRELKKIYAAARLASSALPHATYFGQSGKEALPLLDDLVKKITTAIHPEAIVFVAETKSYAIHPK